MLRRVARRLRATDPFSIRVWATALLPTAATLAILAACGDVLGPKAGNPAEVRVNGGSGQTGQVGQQLSGLLEVLVVDSKGRGVPNTAVDWAVTSGGGQIAPQGATTDDKGIARARWTLGPQAGQQAVRATVGELAPVTFVANATPGPVAAIAIVDGHLQSGQAGTPLPKPLVVRVTDFYQNPLQGVTIQWTVEAGGGQVSPATSTTDQNGLASTTWTLGPVPGQDQVTHARYAGVEPAIFRANAVSDKPTTIEIVSGNDQMAQIGQTLAQPLVVQVTDKNGHPVPGVPLTWTKSSEDTFLSVETTTDMLGRASATLRLGTSPTVRTVAVQVADLEPAVFTVRAFAPLEIGTTRSGLSAGAGTQSLYRANLTSNSSSLTVSTQGANGRVHMYVRHDAPPEPGAPGNACAATPDSGEATCTIDEPATGNWYILLVAQQTYQNVALRATVPFNLSIANAYITQSIQNWNGDVRLVANRDGILRVFVQSTVQGIPSPDVRVTLYHGPTQVATYDLSRSGTVPTSLQNVEASFANSWNVFVPGNLIQPGLRMRAELISNEPLDDDNPADNAFPSAGARDLTVWRVPPFRVTFIPVRQTAVPNQPVGDVNVGNAEQYLTVVREMFPFDEIDWQVAPPYDFGQVFVGNNDTNTWVALLTELTSKWNNENPGRHYYGVVKMTYVSGIAGFGNVGTTPVAVGWDLSTNRARIAAHEWGHNFGRIHVKCPNKEIKEIKNTDLQYPYTDGIIGQYGVRVGESVQASTIYPPSQRYDIMGYCTPAWISDYTYQRIMNFRDQVAGSFMAMGIPGGEDYGVAGDAGADAGADGVSRKEPVLSVWGREVNGELVLEPAFRVDGQPSLPEAPGPYALEGYDESGNRLFSISFAGTQVADAPGGAMLFSFNLPESMAPADRLARLRLIGPRGEVSRTSAGAATGTPPAPPAMQSRGGRAVGITWDATWYPMVMVRDATTGRVISFARGGDIELPDAPPELELVMSDGVRSWTRRYRVP